MTRLGLSLVAFAAIAIAPQAAWAVRSAELYSVASYGYGRVEARVRFAAGNGVVSSFFLWKEGSEKAGTFWNELDFEKLEECQLETNPLYGNPAKVHSQRHTLGSDLCGEFHVYAYEWTPDYISWLVDGVEIRRETEEAPMAYATNASTGMQVHFNLWPGDASFGGTFSPDILPVHQYVDWVQFSSYADGNFTMQWRETFDAGTVPAGWQTGSWASPKNLSTHDPLNVNFIEGYAVLSLTADDATGPAGAMPADGGTGGSGMGAGGSASSAGSAPVGGTVVAAGAGGAGMTAPAAGDSGGCSLSRSRQPLRGFSAFGLAALAGLLRFRRIARGWGRLRSARC